MSYAQFRSGCIGSKRQRERQRSRRFKQFFSFARYLRMGVADAVIGWRCAFRKSGLARHGKSQSRYKTVRMSSVGRDLMSAISSITRSVDKVAYAQVNCQEPCGRSCPGCLDHARNIPHRMLSIASNGHPPTHSAGRAPCPAGRVT